MFTTFRDGLQSVFGGKTRVADILPAMKLSREIGIRHFEFGGGARYQAPFFYVGENPFECMDQMHATVGPDVELQILTRSISGVTLASQRLETLRMQAQLMKKHHTTWDRNFDFMNDVRNLARTGQLIVDAGMHHQVCVSLMGLPFASDQAHTAEFYADVIRRFMETGTPFHSVCMKDASGSTDPKTCYETARAIKAMLPPEIPLWQHTHDTASMAVACYMAGIEGGVDGIDLAVRPLASGTSQPDVRSMAHALKGTGYELDMDTSRIGEVEEALNEGLKDYEFSPVTTSPDARVVGFPMPGGAIGPNVLMMASAGILDKYNDVLKEFPVVVQAGGGWTSVTPGSQQYWLQAFNNVLHGRWKKMDPGYGKSILGYFGKPPLEVDADVQRIASEQLKLPVFDGDPLEAAEDTLHPAKKALEERGLELSDENIFLVASAMVSGKNIELNEGIRLLEGRSRITLPLKKKSEPQAEAKSPAASPSTATNSPSLPTGPVTTECVVEENGHQRRFKVTLAFGAEEKIGQSTEGVAASQPNVNQGSGGKSHPIFSPFEGEVELVELLVKERDHVQAGQVVAAVEAMKAKHEIKTPVAGYVQTISASIGSMVTADHSILTLETE